MTIRRLCKVILLSAMLPFAAIASDWQVKPDASNLRFSGSAQGEAFTGEFKRFDATIRFDPSDLDNARFDVRIVLDSLDSSNAERDEALRSDDFFDVGQYAEAHFIADSFSRSDDGSFVAAGTLALRGVTRDVSLGFRWDAGQSDAAALDGKATLSRLAFGVGGGDWADTDLIDDQVIVTTHLQLAPSPTP